MANDITMPMMIPALNAINSSIVHLFTEIVKIFINLYQIQIKHNNHIFL